VSRDFKNRTLFQKRYNLAVFASPEEVSVANFPCVLLAKTGFWEGELVDYQVIQFEGLALHHVVDKYLELAIDALIIDR
jgi:hypothetical protein